MAPRSDTRTLSQGTAVPEQSSFITDLSALAGTTPPLSEHSSGHRVGSDSPNSISSSAVARLPLGAQGPCAFCRDPDCNFKDHFPDAVPRQIGGMYEVLDLDKSISAYQSRANSRRPSQAAAPAVRAPSVASSCSGCAIVIESSLDAELKTYRDFYLPWMASMERAEKHF